MTGAFRWAIRRYGRTAVCRSGTGAVLGRGMAILRPRRLSGRQWTGGALGRGMEDTWLGLAEAELPAEQLGADGWLEWGGGRFEVLSCQPIPVGGQVTHLRLALRPCGETAP